MGRLEVLGSQTGGVWTSRESAAAGLSRQQVATKLHSGEWQRVRPRVFTDGGCRPSPLARGWAAVLASGGAGRAWISGRTLLRLLDLPLVDDDDPATGAHDEAYDDVVVAGPVRLQPLPTLLRSRSRLLPGDTTAVAGCPATTLPYALARLPGVMSHEALACAIDGALHRGLLTWEELVVVAARRAGQRGASGLRRAAVLADERAETPIETLGRLLLLPVLPGLVPQVRLLDEDSRVIARFDLADEALKLAVEGDGRVAHAGPAMVARDRVRDWRSEALGWRTERYTWFDVRRRQAQLQARVLAAARAQALGRTAA